MSAGSTRVIWVLVRSTVDERPEVRALLPGEAFQLDPAHNWSAPVSTPVANIFAGHEHTSGASCEIIDWTFDKDPEDQLRKMRKDVYDTYVGVADCNVGEINWDEVWADMRVERWDGDKCDAREVYWKIIDIEVPVARRSPAGV